MLARRRAQREEPFLDTLEPGRAAAERARLGCERGDRLARFERGAVECRARRVEPAHGLVAQSFERALGLAERAFGAALALELAQRGLDRFLDPLAIHEERALLGEALLLARLGVERVELGERMAQVVLLGARLGERAFGVGAFLDERAPGAPGALGRLERRAMSAKVVERDAVSRRVHEAALGELRLDLDQALADLAHQSDARRLVVDEGAAAPVGAEIAAQDERVAGGGKAGVGDERARRMVRRQRELGADHRLLGAAAHQRAVRAHAERQAQRVEQDRFAGAGLAGQHA